MTLKLLRVGEAGINRRRHGRVRTESLTCANSEVLDMSASGMRIQMKGRVTFHQGDQVSFRLRAINGHEVLVDGRVAWIRRVGFRKHQVGVAFVNLTPDRMRNLLELVREAAASLMIAQSPA